MGSSDHGVWYFWEFLWNNTKNDGSSLLTLVLVPSFPHCPGFDPRSQPCSFAVSCSRLCQLDGTQVLGKEELGNGQHLVALGSEEYQALPYWELLVGLGPRDLRNSLHGDPSGKTMDFVGSGEDPTFPGQPQIFFFFFKGIK